MYQACIFDLDGTLCDSVESIAYCANRVLREMGMKEASLEDYKVFVGDGVDMLIRRLLRFGGDIEGIRFDETKRRYLDYFRTDCMYHIAAYPGVAETVAELKKRGARLGVLSNKPHPNTKDVIKGVFGTELFDWVQGQSEQFPRKPDPAGALYLAGKLGVSPGECLYIGDTGTDMRTGKAAGMHTIGVLWGFRGRKELEETGADEIVEEPSQLLDCYGHLSSEGTA